MTGRSGQHERTARDHAGLLWGCTRHAPYRIGLFWHGRDGVAYSREIGNLGPDNDRGRDTGTDDPRSY